MARKFDVTNIVDPRQAPFTERSLRHINTAFDELGEDLVKSVIGTYTTNDIIVLYGCAVTATIPGTSSVTAGAIFYNGRIYKVDAASISTPSNTLVWVIDTTYITGDPALFSDGNSYDFHEIQKFKLVNAVSGSGLANYNGATVKQVTDILLGSWIDATPYLINGYTAGPSRVFKYKISRDGTIKFMGGLQAPGTVSSIQFMQLPTNLRPTNNFQYPSCGNDSSSGNYVMTIIGSTGYCSIQPTTGGVIYLGSNEQFNVFCEWSNNA